MNRKLNRVLEAALEHDAVAQFASGLWVSAACFNSLEKWLDDCEVRARVELKGGSQFFSGAFASPYDGPSFTLTANYP